LVVAEGPEDALKPDCEAIRALCDDSIVCPGRGVKVGDEETLWWELGSVLEKIYVMLRL